MGIAPHRGMTPNTNAEQQRLTEARDKGVPWRKWGPYLSERQWGTVREDYSENGDAWNYFSHDQARSRAYHWGEDGLAGFSDDQQALCFALALWNGRDPILKERLFGLTNSEGNHGEDVKEYYFYLDATPTHSYLKWLYKYPQEEYPYLDIVTTNRQRSRGEFEYELVDTGVFRDSRYFDVFVRIREGLAGRHVDPGYAPSIAGRSRRRCTCCRRSGSATPGASGRARRNPSSTAPMLCNGFSGDRRQPRRARTALSLRRRRRPSCFSPRTRPTTAALFGGDNAGPYVKDGINDHVVQGAPTTAILQGFGTKAAGASDASSSARARRFEWRLRLTDASPEASPNRSPTSIESWRRGEREADEFYSEITPPNVDDRTGSGDRGRRWPG